MKRVSTIAAIAASGVIAVSGLTACGSSGTSDSGPASASEPASPTPTPSRASSPGTATSSPGGASSEAPATITIKDFTYKTSGTVKAGSTVMITNQDTEAHTVTADSKGGFDVKIEPGKTATLTAPGAGNYKYHCTYHADMHGTLTVG